MHRGSKRAALIGAAALPAIAGLSATLMSSSAADAAITFSITNNGVAKDGVGHTATGWSSYTLTFIADTGNNITAVDFGGSTSDPNGILGPLLQNYFSTKNSGATPVGTFQNGSGPDLVAGGNGGLDSHFLGDTSQFAITTSPFEDSNHVNPGSGIPANDSTNSDFYGTGSYLHGVYGITGANQKNAYPVAYVVLKDGTSATFKSSVAEAGNTAILSGTIGGTVVSGGPIISLTAAAPVGFGNKLTNGAGVDQATFNPNAPVANSINVTGPGSGSYVPGFANNVNGGTGQNTFNVAYAGFNPGTDQEVFALDLKHATGGADTTPAEEVTIANEINQAGGQAAGGIAVNAVSFANAPASLQALFPTYDIFLLTTGNPGTTSGFLGVNLPNETGVGGLVAANVAAVPEPATAAGILLGAAGLLLGRRKRQA
jgi:hypothetical protein